LAASVPVLELQRIAPLIEVPFDNVKVPPLMVPVKVMACTAAVVEVPCTVVATAMVAAAPLLTVRLFWGAVRVARGPRFWNVTVAVVTLPLVLTVTVTGSSLAVVVPELVPMETLVMVPWPAAPIEPPLLVQETPDKEPPEIVPVFVLKVELLMVPEPEVVSSTAVTVPVLVPMETLVMVPWPAAPIEPPLLVQETPDKEPPEIVPVLVLKVELLMVPEPEVVSSLAVTVPVLVPMETLVMVP
jgi:hypothetical protein